MSTNMKLSFFQFKQSWASLKQKPAYTFSVISTIGLTLGALLAVLSLVYVMLIKPLPYPEQDRLYKVESLQFDSSNAMNVSAFSYASLMNFHKNQQSFTDSTLMVFDDEVLTSLISQPTVSTNYVSSEWFTLFAVDMELGRGFEQSEGLNTDNPVAVISYQTWQTEFLARQDIIDQKVTIRGINFSIIGVAAASFVEPEIIERGRKTQIFLPWSFNSYGIEDRKSWWGRNNSLIFLGLLSPDVSTEQAIQSSSILVDETWQKNIDREGFYKGWHIEMQLTSLQSLIIGESENDALLLLIGVLGLMLIATINIANLQLSRTVEQQDKLAIFSAVGAKPKDIFSYFFSEALLLMLMSMIVALGIAHLSFILIKSQLHQVLPRVDELSISLFTLMSALFIAIALALFFARMSYKVVNYQQLNSRLQGGGKGTGAQVSQTTRQLLIVSQVSVATLLIFININVFNQAYNTITEAVGFNVDNLMSVGLTPSSAVNLSREQQAGIIEELQLKIAQLPQVNLVSRNSSPLTDGERTWSLTETKTNKIVLPIGKSIDNHYFDLMGQSFIAGDNFNAQDYVDRAPSLVINQVLAKQLSTGEAGTTKHTAIGQKLSFGGPNAFTIIGIVNDFELPGQSHIPPRVYMPNLNRSSLLIQLKEHQTITRQELVELTKSVSSNISLYRLSSLPEQKFQRLFSQYTSAITTSALTLITFILSAIGLYGVLSYSTQMRRFEIGTRLAVGAKRFDVIKLIIKDNASSIALGILASFVMLAVLIFGFSDQINSYLTMALLPVLLITLSAISFISFIACYLPLRQYINSPVVHSLKGSE